MATIIIRDVPDETLAAIKQAASVRSISQQQLLAEIVEKEFGNPPMVIGYVECDRQGEFETCPECGQTIRHAWIQFFSNGAFNLVCNFCATSE